MDNAATTAPDTIQAEPSVNADNGEAGQETKPDLATEIALVKERYSHSSAEGKRLAEENKQLNLRLAALENRSLKSDSNNQSTAFPSEESYIQYAVENEKTEKEARMEYREKKIFWDNQQALSTTIQALMNKQRFDAELNEKSYIEQSPEAQKAIESFKGIPELESLPMVEQVQRYKEIQKRMGVKVDGRDMSRVKMAASGTGAGISTGASFETPNAEKDTAAKAAGFPSWKAAQEMQQCKTAEQAKAIKLKYKMK